MRQWFRCAPLVLCLVTACSGTPGSRGNGGPSLGQESESQAATAKLPPAPPGYTATAYPIVLIPGFLGFTKLVGTVEYFSGVADTLEASGAKVYQVTVSQASDSIT